MHRHIQPLSKAQILSLEITLKLNHTHTSIHISEGLYAVIEIYLAKIPVIAWIHVFKYIISCPLADISLPVQQIQINLPI